MYIQMLLFGICVPEGHVPFPMDFLGVTSPQEQIASGKWQRMQQAIAVRLRGVKGDRESMLSNDTPS
jgi:hypothetical protein